MKIKSIIFILLTAFATLLATPHSAQAHVLKTDKDIGAVFHVTPDDDPIAGQESEFFFEIKDKTNKFSPAKCDCQVVIQQENQILFNQSLFHSQHSNNPTAGGFAYTFPEKAIYTVIITGTPTDETSFQSFTLTYDLRVDRQTQSNTQNTPSPRASIPLAYILLPIILVIFLTIALVGKKKNGSPKNLIMIILGLLISTTILNTRPLLILEQIHHDQTAIHHEQSHPCCIPQFIATGFDINLTPEIAYYNTLASEPQKIYHSAIKSLIKNKSPPVT